MKKAREVAKNEPPQRLDDVLRALVRNRTLAIVYAYLEQHVADAFRGNDVHPPKKLLAMPNGTRCRAEIDDVLTVERVLRRLAADARKKVDELQRAEVFVDRAAVAPEQVPNDPVSPPPEGEGVVDAPAARPAASSAAGTTGS